MIDEHGLPGTEGDNAEFDGGDTAAILGTIGALSDQSPDLMPILGVNAPVRHPDTTKWYGQEDRFSRDQLIPIICAGVHSGAWPVNTIYRWHRRRWFLTAWNTRGNGALDMPKKFPDITGPEVWALWIRFKRPWWARLILCFLDLETMIGSIVWRFQPKSNRLTRNHMLVCITGMRTLPGITMRLANWINDWDDLIGRWKLHCVKGLEYDTAELFEKHIRSQRRQGETKGRTGFAERREREPQISE